MDHPSDEAAPTAGQDAQRKFDSGARRNGVQWIVVGLIMACLLVGLGFAIRVANENGTKATANGDLIISLSDDVKALRAQVTVCKNKPANTVGCTVPVAPEPTAVPQSPQTIAPQVIQGKTGQTGAVGAQGPGPSFAQTLAAVTAWCAQTGQCSPKGPTPQQVAKALAAYCDDHGNCTPVPKPGPAGPTGAPGSEGQKGDTGPKGDGPTAEQVATGILNFCNAPGSPCVGPKGEKGETGSTGPDGPKGATGAQGVSLVKMTCNSNTQQFEIFLSDDPEKPIPVEGSDCVAGPLPPPSESP